MFLGLQEFGFAQI